MEENVGIREYGKGDLAEMVRIWNAVVEDGNAFPQEDPLTAESGAEFFGGQSRSAVAEVGGKIAGLYILHPNNVGRCGHIANASYAVDKSARGKGVGELLVRDSLEQAKRLGFRILQFNAVVSTNARARRLYETLGFTPLGTIPDGFRLEDGRFEDICPYFKVL